MIYSELKKPLTIYLVAGITLSIIIISVILTAKYEKNLLYTMTKFELIRTNSFKMERNIAEMNSLVKEINSLLPSHYYFKDHKEIMLLGFDEIKTTLKDAEITVKNFNSDAHEISLPVTISIPVNSYVQMVNNIGYLQTLNFPYFAIKSIVIETPAKGPFSGTICKIEGILRMPAEKLTRNKT
ncbi:MAG: hypothetical protein AB1610_06800 [Nitrospirota bacterium]